LDPYKLPDPTGQQQLVAAGKQAAERFLGILDTHIIGAHPYLCGDEITLADYFASGILSLGEVIGCRFAAFPNVRRWYDAMRARPNWQAANEGVMAWADFARGPVYVTV
jgi:glutathione S-transferase